MLTPRPLGMAPGQRFRLEQWAPILAARHGIEFTFLPFESPELTNIIHEPGRLIRKARLVLRDFFRRSRAVTEARRFDGVIVYREASLIGPAIYERALARAGIPLFFDFDDALWEESSARGDNGWFRRLHFWGKTATNCRLASHVFAGNEYLRDYAARYNDNVTIIPTTIDLADYPVQPEPEDSRFTVCWTGSTFTLPFFEHARPVLTALAERVPLRVKIICNRPPAQLIKGAENLFVPWSSETEAEDIGACHVGVMPLPDNPFTRGKCGLKAAQFMATGRPVVISPVGMNRSLIRDGENGFLASGPSEWLERLEQLAAFPELRRRLGSAGRKTIEAQFSADHGANAVAAALRSVIDQAAVAAL